MFAYFAAAGALGLFAGAVLTSQRISGSVSRRRRIVGDGLAYLGIAIWVGGAFWWLFG